MNKSNKNKLSKIKIIKIKNNNTKRKRKRRTPFKNYKYVIRTAIVNYATPDYTEKNLNFDVYDLLRQTKVFQQISGQYSQYKLDKVTFIGIPRQIGGTDPSPIWIYLDTSGLDSFNYVGMQELQGSRSLPVKYTSFTRFSNSGRQDDFHYWYDVTASQADTKEQSDVSIRLHSEATPTSFVFWQFQLEFTVHFRGFIVEMDNNNKMNKVEQKVKVIKQEGEGLEDEQDVKDEEIVGRTEP